MSSQGRAGRLYVVATPIGNLGDITLRALRVLEAADVIAAEDTRTTRKLLAHHGIGTPLVSCHEHNEDVRTPELLDRIAAGQSVAVVSEAGTPSISDPGYRLVRGAIERGLTVEPVPGASAILAALVVSGLPTDAFVFEGFLPRRAAERRRRFEALAAEPRTLVFFEAPHRIDTCLADALEVLGDRSAALCRELTKLHEEIRRGTLSSIAESVRKQPAKGEIVLVVDGATRVAGDLDEAVDEVLARTSAGDGLRDAAREVAATHGLSRRTLYDRVLHRRAGA